MTTNGIKSLAAATILQAMKDYVRKYTSEAKKRAILTDLRSEWMDFFTDGMSIIAAEQLEKHPKEIAKRILRELQEEN